jgi:OFA family oxalate/formate antiporter-like MFS transporter
MTASAADVSKMVAVSASNVSGYDTFGQPVVVSSEQTLSFMKENRSMHAQLSGIVAVFGGMLAHCVFGSLYCWGNFSSYTAANMKNFNGMYDPAHSSQTDTLQVLPATLVFQALAMPFGSSLTERFGPSAVIAVAGLLCALAPYLSSFATTLSAFMFLYAGLLGTGMGLGYTAPLVCGYKHFPNAKGIVSGCVLGAFGLGGFIFNKLGSALLNPEGLAADPATKLYPPAVTDAFGDNFRKLSMVYFVFTLIAFPLIRMPRIDASTTRATVETSAAWSVKDAMCTKTFWIMWLAIAVSAQGGLYVSSSYKSIAINFPALHDDRYLASVGAIGSLTNGLMRPVWGFLYDRFGFHACFSVIAAIQVVVICVFPQLSASPPLYALGVVASYACLAGNFTLAPTETYKLFGNAAVYGCLYSSFATAGIFGSKVANFVANMFSLPEDNTLQTVSKAFMFLSLMSLLALVVLQFHRPPQKSIL